HDFPPGCLLCDDGGKIRNLPPKKKMRFTEGIRLNMYVIDMHIYRILWRYAMPYVNLKLSEKQASMAKMLAMQLRLNRSEYLRRAIDHYNKIKERELLAQQFKNASLKCREESLRVNKEFDLIDQVPE
ncbi:MAG: hypothetical protein ONB41_23890, partial [candidate division KSB1 bacterium]|nr:hypothetical protein [candidate division KSB1 bacterium]